MSLRLLFCQVQPNNSTMRRQRPVSQPIPSNVVNGEIVPKSPLPEISEFSPNSPQYASSSSEFIFM